MYPLVRELSRDGIPVTMTCRVLKIARQPYYRWLVSPISNAELEEAYLANAIFDAHRDDPEFGYRFLADEIRAGGFDVCDRTVWKICQKNRWWSVFGKPKAAKKAKAGSPAHDDLVRRDFSAAAPNELWLADITEHRTDEGKLYLCAIKDACSNRIVGYSIADRMKARLAVNALDNAAARRGDVAGCILHTDRGSQGELNRSSQHLTIAEVSDGATATASGPGASTLDAFTWAADPLSACRARVLAPDRAGQAHRGCRDRGRRVSAGRVALVSSCWRHVALEPGRADRPLSVVPRT